MIPWNVLTLWMMAQAEGAGDAPAGPASPFGSMGGIPLLVIMFAIFYFLLIRPASKQRKQHQSMLNALKKNDEVVTNGGIYGRVVALEDKVATLEIADKVKIRILRDRIASRIEPEANAASK